MLSLTNLSQSSQNMFFDVQVRQKLVGKGDPTYSQYTCYTGIADFTPPDIDTVGYRVFLGNGRYFVSSDVGGGKMQWYGFHKEPQGESMLLWQAISLQKVKLLKAVTGIQLMWSVVFSNWLEM